MMLQPSEEEYEALLKCKEEKDPEKKQMWHNKYRKLREERERFELKDCPFAHQYHQSIMAGDILYSFYKKGQSERI